MPSSDFNYSGDNMAHRWQSEKSEGRLKLSRQELMWAHKSNSNKNKERRYNDYSLKIILASFSNNCAIVKYLWLPCAAYLFLSNLGFF